MDLDSVDVLHRPTDRAALHAHLAAGATPLAGGTALMGEYSVRPTALVDLLDLGWPSVETLGDGTVRIAGTATLRAVADAPALAPVRPFVVSALTCLLASWKIWSRGTLGGNICAALPAGAATAAAATLDGTALIWGPDGDERTLPVAEMVLGPGVSALRPGEVLRAVDVPAASLGARYALRRTALSEYGRSGSLVNGRADADGTATLVVTAATPAPVVLRFDHLPSPGEASETVAALTGWYSDPHGSPRWRRHVSALGAASVAAELATSQKEPTS